jgi:hypothetical protein
LPAQKRCPMPLSTHVMPALAAMAMGPKVPKFAVWGDGRLTTGGFWPSPSWPQEP